MKAMKPALVPLGDRVLVELLDQFQNIATTTGKYDSKTSGICRDIGDGYQDNLDYLIGKVVFWEQFKDHEHLVFDGKKYSFVKLEDLDGYSNE